MNVMILYDTQLSCVRYAMPSEVRVCSSAASAFRCVAMVVSWPRMKPFCLCTRASLRLRSATSSSSFCRISRAVAVLDTEGGAAAAALLGEEERLLPLAQQRFGAAVSLQEMGVSGTGSREHGDASGEVFWMPYNPTFLKYYYATFPENLPSRELLSCQRVSLYQVVTRPEKSSFAPAATLGREGSELREGLRGVKLHIITRSRCLNGDQREKTRRYSSRAVDPPETRNPG